MFLIYDLIVEVMKAIFVKDVTLSKSIINFKNKMNSKGFSL